MDRIQKAENSSEAVQEGMVFSDKIKGQNSFQDLMTNLSHSFRKHYSRIPKYKENLMGYGLIDQSTQVRTMFLVEDVSPLGSMVIDNDGKQRPVIVLLCSEFLDLFSEAVDLDYVLACSSTAYENYMWFADRHEIDKYYMHAVDYSRMTFLDFGVQITGFKIALPQGHEGG